MFPRLAVLLQRDDDAFVLAVAMMSSVLVLFVMYDNNCSAMNERTVDWSDFLTPQCVVERNGVFFFLMIRIYLLVEIDGHSLLLLSLVGFCDAMV